MSFEDDKKPYKGNGVLGEKQNSLGFV